jgi:probable HAF family extracellular repeat protein
MNTKLLGAGRMPAILSVLALLSWSGGALSQTYTVTDLGTLGGTYSYPTGINASGQVAGESFFAGDNVPRATLWNGTKASALAQLPGTDYTSTGSINAAGEVVGDTSVIGSTNEYAVVWKGTTATVLDTLGGLHSAAHGINDAGQPVGRSFASDNRQEYAVLWNGTLATALGTLGGTYSDAYAINNAAQVVGYSNTKNDAAAHAVIWNGTQATDLGVLPGTTDSYAFGVNDLGQVVGVSSVAVPSGNPLPNTLSHPVMWTGTTPTDLGILPGYDTSEVLGINNAGQVVGDSATFNTGAQHATLWMDGKSIDLNSLISPALSKYVTLERATAINVKGWIAASGTDTRTGNTHAYLLVPVAPLTVTCPTATARQGSFYSSALTASGGIPPDMFFSTGNLPGGLVLNKSTGALVGTPLASGAFTFTAQVTDSSVPVARTATKSCTITISAPADFSLTASPQSISVAAGGKGIVSIESSPLRGFTGTIALAASGLPTGASAAFAPASIQGSGTSALTLAAGTARAGTYQITVTGKSGSLSHRVTVSLTITSHLKLSVSPASLDFGTVHQFSLKFRVVDVHNVGTGTVTLSKATVTPGGGADRGDFTPISLCGSTLDPGERCSILVVMFAEDLGRLSATLNIRSNAAASPQAVPLRVNVIPIGH